MNNHQVSRNATGPQVSGKHDSPTLDDFVPHAIDLSQTMWTARRAAIEPFLLALHRTVEADDFWIALQNLLDAALPNHSIVAAVRASGDNPPVFYHSHHRPHHTHTWFTRTLTAHPCYAHLMAHPGLPVLRLSEVLPEDILKGHSFFREFMEPEGWNHGAGLRLLGKRQGRIADPGEPLERSAGFLR